MAFEAASGFVIRNEDRSFIRHDYGIFEGIFGAGVLVAMFSEADKRREVVIGKDAGFWYRGGQRIACIGQRRPRNIC